MRKLLALCVILWSGSIHAAISLDENKWELASDGIKGMTVYTQVVPDQPIRAVKAIFELEAPLESMLNVLTQTDSLVEWFPILKQAVLLKETDEKGMSVMYMESALPWPIKNRDLVVETITKYDSASDTVTMDSKDLEGFKERVYGLVRIPTSNTYWKIKRHSKNNLRVELITHSDPGGNIPGWFANMLVTQLPKVVYGKLKKALEEDVEKNTPFNSVFVFGKETEL